MLKINKGAWMVISVGIRYASIRYGPTVRRSATAVVAGPGAGPEIDRAAPPPPALAARRPAPCLRGRAPVGLGTFRNRSTHSTAQHAQHRAARSKYIGCLPPAQHAQQVSEASSACHPRGPVRGTEAGQAQHAQQDAGDQSRQCWGPKQAQQAQHPALGIEQGRHSRHSILLGTEQGRYSRHSRMLVTERSRRSRRSRHSRASFARPGATAARLLCRAPPCHRGPIHQHPPSP